MTAYQAWVEWLDGVAAKYDSDKVFGEKLGVSYNMVWGWRKGGLPHVIREQQLAELGGVKVEAVHAILDAARQERDRAAWQARDRRADLRRGRNQTAASAPNTYSLMRKSLAKAGSVVIPERLARLAHA